MLADDLPRGRVQVPRAAVIAEPFPQPQDVVLVGGGQGGQRGKASQEPLEIWDDGRHRRLLQHDLADPDAVRVARSAPGKIAIVHGGPAQQLAAQSRQLTRVGKLGF